VIRPDYTCRHHQINGPWMQDSPDACT